MYEIEALRERADALEMAKEAAYAAARDADATGADDAYERAVDRYTDLLGRASEARAEVRRAERRATARAEPARGGGQ